MHQNQLMKTMHSHSFNERNVHHARRAWTTTVRNLVRSIRQRGIRDLVVSFEPSDELKATLYTGPTHYELSRNGLIGFTLLTMGGVEYTICEENAAEELYYLISEI